MGKIEERKNQRIKNLNKNKRIVLAIIFFIGIVVAIFFNRAVGIILAITPFIINAMLDTGVDIVRGENHLSKKIKEELAPRIIKSTLPDSEYMPYDGITEEEYKLSEYNETVNNFSSDDKIKTHILINNNRINIEFVQVSLKKEAKDKEPFIGIFGYAKLPKDIRSKIKIKKEGTYNQENIFKYDVNYREFEENFDVIAPNKALANRIITQELMNKIIEIYNTYGYMIEVNIIRDYVYIRVNSGSMIIDTIDGEIIDRIVMEKHYNMLKSLVELVEKICTIVSNLE